MYRTNTVQQLLQKDVNQIHPNEVFKTRTKVVDDRNISPSPNSSVVDDYLASLNTQKSPKKTAWDRSAQKVEPRMLIKELSGLSPTPLQDLSEMLQSSSEVFLLPDIEQKYLEQYRIDVQKLSELDNKVEVLNRKVKEVRLYIKERLNEEQHVVVNAATRIQAWYRGCKTRKRLGISNNRFKYTINDKTIKAATKIQALWRGYHKRQQLGPEFQLQLLRRIVFNQQKTIQRLAREDDPRSGNELKQLKEQFQAQQELLKKQQNDLLNLQSESKALIESLQLQLHTIKDKETPNTQE